jgi:hypothetical protein
MISTKYYKIVLICKMKMKTEKLGQTINVDSLFMLEMLSTKLY